MIKCIGSEGIRLVVYIVDIWQIDLNIVTLGFNIDYLSIAI